MSQEYVNIDDLKRQQRINRIKGWFKDRYLDAICFYQNNRELCVVVIPAALTFGTTAIRFAGKRMNARNERIHREREVYDRHLDATLRMRRRPTKKEWDIIAERRKNHESYYSILSSMKLLDRVV